MHPAPMTSHALSAAAAISGSPSGIPVATVAINGGANAGILAAKILAVADDKLLARLKDYSRELKESVQAKDARLQEVGYKNYTNPYLCLLPAKSTNSNETFQRFSHCLIQTGIFYSISCLFISTISILSFS